MNVLRGIALGIVVVLLGLVVALGVILLAVFAFLGLGDLSMAAVVTGVLVVAALLVLAATHLLRVGTRSAKGGRTKPSPRAGTSTRPTGTATALSAPSVKQGRIGIAVGVALVAVVVGLGAWKVTTGGSGFKWSDEDPSWSPDGREIAFASDRANRRQQVFSIYVMSLHGGSPTRVTSSEDAGRPVWSPDGHRLAYVSNSLSFQTQRVHVINVDGSENRSLAELGNVEGLAWSPNGRWLAIDACNSACRYAPAGAIREALYIVHPNGRGLRRISENTNTFAWAPNGSRLVYTKPLSKAGETLYVSQVATGRRILLAELKTYVLNVAWSPDHSQIALVEARHFVDSLGDDFENMHVSTIDTTGGGQRTIARIGGTRDWINLAWLPHTHALLYFRACDGSGIYLASTVRRSSRTIASDGCDAVPSPKGRSILFVKGESDVSSAIFLAAPNGASTRQVTQR
jgi:dipeptidyl aminopeptidase/acylaminoacyl peptidase